MLTHLNDVIIGEKAFILEIKDHFRDKTAVAAFITQSKKYRIIPYGYNSCTCGLQILYIGCSNIVFSQDFHVLTMARLH